MLITGICYLGNISRTQNVKKDKISFPFTSILLLSIIKLPTVNICQISRKTSALKTQILKIVFRRGILVWLKIFLCSKTVERNTCLLQPTCNASLSRIFFVCQCPRTTSMQKTCCNLATTLCT